MSYHHAKRCPAPKKNTRREDLEISCPVTQIWSFSGTTHIYPRVDIPEKATPVLSALET